MLTLLFLLPAAAAHHARSADAVRPPVGGVESLPEAMIFYLAHGPEGTCGQNCSEWIAAEGHVYWDTHKRLLALLDRVGERKPPVFVSNPGEGHDLNISTAIGRIIRERGLDVSVGSTLVQRCAGATEAACFALKRGGGPLQANIDRSSVHCNLACVLILAGGVRRTLPGPAKVIVSGMRIRSRLGLIARDCGLSMSHSCDLR